MASAAVRPDTLHYRCGHGWARVCARLAVWGELSAFSLPTEEAQSARHLSRSAEGNFLPPACPSPLCCSLLCVVTDAFRRVCWFPAISSVLCLLNIMAGPGRLITVLLVSREESQSWLLFSAVWCKLVHSTQKSQSHVRMIHLQ